MKLNSILAVIGITLFTLTSCSQSGNVRGKKEALKRAVRHSKPSGNNVQDQVYKSSLQQLYQLNKDAVFLIYTYDGETYRQGSGFFISATGIGVSNYHVFEDTLKGGETIKLLTGEQLQIMEVIASSKELDYIVFRVDNPTQKSFQHVKISTSDIFVGENVFAIGNPKGLESTLSEGIISSIRESDKLIQMTAEITHGSSGGPLFNMAGEVIGITTSGLGEANLNFAVDIRRLNLH